MTNWSLHYPRDWLLIRLNPPRNLFRNMITSLLICQSQAGDEILDQIFTIKSVRNQPKIFLTPNKNRKPTYLMNLSIQKSEFLLNRPSKHHLLKLQNLPQLILNWHKQIKQFHIKHLRHHFLNNNNKGWCLNFINLLMTTVEKFKLNSHKLCRLYKHLPHKIAMIYLNVILMKFADAINMNHMSAFIKGNMWRNVHCLHSVDHYTWN